jgi:hypothetical protein
MTLTEQMIMDLIRDKPDTMDDLIKIFMQAEEIKQTLRSMGYGCTGMPFYETCMEFINESR